MPSVRRLAFLASLALFCAAGAVRADDAPTDGGADGGVSDGGSSADAAPAPDAVSNDDIEIEKPLYSGFYQTSLEAQLRAAGVDTLVFTGYTTECCVDTNVRDAFHRGFHCLLVADACAAYSPDLHAASLKALGYSSALIVNAAEVQAAWQEAAR